MNDGWKLYRHNASKADYSGRPAAIYWARPVGDEYEISAGTNAAGNGSEDEGELLPPGLYKSGRFPAEAIRQDYRQTTPEELGLKINLNAGGGE